MVIQFNLKIGHSFFVANFPFSFPMELTHHNENSVRFQKECASESVPSASNSFI